MVLPITLLHPMRPPTLLFESTDCGHAGLEQGCVSLGALNFQSCAKRSRNNKISKYKPGATMKEGMLYHVDCNLWSCCRLVSSMCLGSGHLLINAAAKLIDLLLQLVLEYRLRFDDLDLLQGFFFDRAWVGIACQRTGSSRTVSKTIRMANSSCIMMSRCAFMKTAGQLAGDSRASGRARRRPTGCSAGRAGGRACQSGSQLSSELQIYYSQRHARESQALRPKYMLNSCISDLHPHT